MNPRNTPPQGRYTVRGVGSEVVIPRTHGDHRSGARGASPLAPSNTPVGRNPEQEPRPRPGLESKGR